MSPIYSISSQTHDSRRDKIFRMRSRLPSLKNFRVSTAASVSSITGRVMDIIDGMRIILRPRVTRLPGNLSWRYYATATQERGHEHVRYRVFRGS